MLANSLEHLIDLAMEMEKKAFAFYDGLSRRHQDRPEFIACLDDVKKDELLHQRVLKEIRASMSKARLAAPVDAEPIERLQSVIDFLDEVNVEDLRDADDVSQAINTLESVEFDVVLGFVDIEEIDYAFTRDFLQNESVAHTDRIFRAQECFE